MVAGLVQLLSVNVILDIVQSLLVGGRFVKLKVSILLPLVGFLPALNTFGFSGLMCPDLQNPADGSVTYDGLDAGSRAVYTCSQGFRLVGGDGVRTCGSNGTWSGQPPLCSSGLSHSSVLYFPISCMFSAVLIL